MSRFSVCGVRIEETNGKIGQRRSEFRFGLQEKQNIDIYLYLSIRQTKNTARCRKHARGDMRHSVTVNRLREKKTALFVCQSPYRHTDPKWLHRFGTKSPSPVCRGEKHVFLRVMPTALAHLSDALIPHYYPLLPHRVRSNATGVDTFDRQPHRTVTCQPPGQFQHLYLADS